MMCGDFDWIIERKFQRCRKVSTLECRGGFACDGQMLQAEICKIVGKGGMASKIDEACDFEEHNAETPEVADTSPRS